MTPIVSNRLFLALTLGVATSAPPCHLLLRSFPNRAVVSFASVDRVNQRCATSRSFPTYDASPFPRRLRTTGAETDFSGLSNAQTFDRVFLGETDGVLSPPPFEDLFAPACPDGTCPFAAAPSQTIQNTPLPTAPKGVLRSVVRVYNAYEETVSTADVALGPTRRRVVEKGSGAIVADSAGTRYVLTAAHIFRDGRGQITAQSVDGRIFAASLVLASEECDVALLSVEASTDVPALTISASWPRQGETVWRAGFGPNETLRELAGSVKGYVKTDRYSTYETLKIDGPARQGDSGGPVYNASGEIVGVVWGTDGVDAYATYCGRVLKTLCDYSPTFEPNAVQAAVDAPPLASNAPDSATDLTEGIPATCAPQAEQTPPSVADANETTSRSQLRDFWNAALAFAVVFAFGYCGLFATKNR